MKKLPPIEKIYEAYSALADKRVTLMHHEAHVLSSNGKKTYIISWNSDRIYTSNDNASFWQGYPGYPVLAVLMLQDILPYNEKIASFFTGINWNKLNKEYKQNYPAAVGHILNMLENIGVNILAIKKEVKRVYEQIEQLHIDIKRGALRPY